MSEMLSVELTPEDMKARFRRLASDGLVHFTEDGRGKIYELLVHDAGYGNPYQIWNDLVARHPEILQLTEKFQFRGKGQRECDVAGLDSWLRIRMVLANMVGVETRAVAARSLEGDFENGPRLSQASVGQALAHITQVHERRLQVHGQRLDDHDQHLQTLDGEIEKTRDRVQEVEQKPSVVIRPHYKRNEIGILRKKFGTALCAALAPRIVGLDKAGCNAFFYQFYGNMNDKVANGKPRDNWDIEDFYIAVEWLVDNEGIDITVVLKGTRPENPLPIEVEV